MSGIRPHPQPSTLNPQPSTFNLQPSTFTMAESDDIFAEHARQAAEIDADLGVEHIGKVYAEAFLGAAEAAGRTESLMDEFDSLVVDVLDRFPKLEEVLASGFILHKEKAGIIDRVFGARASTVLVGFLKVVSRHERLDCLRAIHRQTHELYDEMRGLVRVRLTTATPVDDALAERIAQRLGSFLGGRPVIEKAVDPELIGGAVVRVDDTVYDGSIATQLGIVREQMIDRSVHEIQSRRDRFRNSAGN